MAVMPPSVSTTSTRAMLAAAETRGFETRDVLTSLGVRRETVEDPDARLAGTAVLELWDALRTRCDDPTLQLAAPTALPFGAYRVIDYLVYASPTVGAGVSRFAEFFRLIAEGVSLTIEERGDERHLLIQGSDGGAVPGPYVDYVFAALVGRIRMRIHPELGIRRLELRHSAPTDPAPYGDCFRAPAGTTFRDVCDATRRGLAMGYLADRRVSISEVAFLLGFSDQASFTRAFRRWTGTSPGTWRKGCDERRRTGADRDATAEPS